MRGWGEESRHAGARLAGGWGVRRGASHRRGKGEEGGGWPAAACGQGERTAGRMMSRQEHGWGGGCGPGREQDRLLPCVRVVPAGGPFGQLPGRPVSGRPWAATCVGAAPAQPRPPRTLHASQRRFGPLSPKNIYLQVFILYLLYVDRGSRWVSLIGTLVMHNTRHHNGYHIFGPCVCIKLLSCDYLHKYLRRLTGGLGTGQRMGHHNTTVVAGAEPKLMGPDHFFLVPPRTALSEMPSQLSCALFSPIFRLVPV